MSEKKLLELVKVTGEETIDVALSDVLPKVVKDYGDIGDIIVSEGAATLAGELIGAITPRLNNIRLSYKQKRLERNISIALDKLISEQKILCERVDKLQKTDDGKCFLQQSGEMLLDNITDEIQQEKVQYSVNGYVNLLQTEKANLDMALMFFKTISELNDIDIRVLRNYDWKNTEKVTPITPFNSEFDNAQLKYIKEKLVRFGLLKSKNEELSALNQKNIIEFLQKSYKDSTSKKPKGVKLPQFKKMQHTDRYSITPLGYALLQLISEQCDMSDLNVPDDGDKE